MNTYSICSYLIIILLKKNFQESLLEREIAALKRELHGARGLAEAERQTVFSYFILCICGVVFCAFLFIHQLKWSFLHICVVVFCAFLLMHQSTFKVVLLKLKIKW